MHPHDEPCQTLCTDLILIHSADGGWLCQFTTSGDEAAYSRMPEPGVDETKRTTQTRGLHDFYTLKQIAKIISMQKWGEIIFPVPYLL